MGAFSHDNWGYPPHNRASFQQVQTLFPTVRLRRGPGPITELPEALRELESVRYEGPDGERRTVGQMLDDTFTDAFVVLEDGVVVTENYRNGMGPDSHHLLNSVTKTFIGMLVGILAEEGVIDPELAVADCIPEFADTAFTRTTLRHTLDMTAAVEFGEDYADRRADFWVETAVVGWRPALVHDGSAATLFDFARSLKTTEQEDGEHFHYRTVLTNVIAMMIERVTGRRVQQLLEERIWKKLGPEQDAAIVVDAAGFPYVGAGMNACARDLARFGQMLLNNGMYDGSQVVPADWIADTMAGNDEARRHFAETDYDAMVPGGHYRNQVWVDGAEKTLICIGIHGQTIHVNQNTGVVIVKLSSHPEPVDEILFADTFLAMAALSKAI